MPEIPATDQAPPRTVKDLPLRGWGKLKPHAEVVRRKPVNPKGDPSLKPPFGEFQRDPGAKGIDAILSHLFLPEADPDPFPFSELAPFARGRKDKERGKGVVGELHLQF
jgi:hypothetical protein